MSARTGRDRELRAARHTRRLTVAVIATLVLVTAAAFLGHNPAAHPYEIRGVFASSNELRIGSDVRIAGFTVGKVTGIAGGPGQTSIVSMRIDDTGRPIHRDAELSIQPRLVLEGNFYVAVRPGTPTAPELPSHGLIPRARTTVPVQLDEVLDTFDLATRGSLHRTIGELSRSLSATPMSTDAAAAVPAGYVSLRHAVDELRQTLPSASRVSRAVRGTEPGDLGRTLRATRDVTAQLAADPRALADGVTNFSRLTGTLAAENRPLRASVRALDRLMRVAPAGLRALDRALPAATRFADELDPALQIAPGPLRRTTALITQLRGLFSAGELPALVTDLAPTLAGLPTLEGRLQTLAPLLTSASNCLRTHVAWTLSQTLKDGPNSTGDPVYLDAAHAESGSGGVVAGFDGNGVAIRAGLVGNGTVLNGVIPGLGHITGMTPKVTGVRPAWLGYGVEPAYRPDQACSAQARPDLTARSAPAPTLPTGGRRVKVGGILP